MKKPSELGNMPGKAQVLDLSAGNEVQSIEIGHLPETLSNLENISDENIILAHLVKALRDLKRLPKWYDQTKENNAEHSYMVSLYSSKFLQDYYSDDPELNEALVKNYAEVHDWVEILAGDTVTLGMSEEDYAIKAEKEEAALQILLDFLRRKGLDHHADLLESYERQDSKAARFVKAVDKIMTKFVNIAGDGFSARIDHGIYSYDQLVEAYALDRKRFASRFGAEFPELLAENDKYTKLSMEQFRRSVAKDIGHYAI